MTRPSEPTKPQLFILSHENVIHVPLGRGDDLRRRLEERGIHALVSRGAETDFDRVEVKGNVDVKEVQALLDQLNG